MLNGLSHDQVAIINYPPLPPYPRWPSPPDPRMSEQPQSNRRDFLVGRAAGDAVVHVVEQVAERVGRLADQLDPQPSEAPSTDYVLMLKRRAMACDFEIRLNARTATGDQAHTAAAMEALDLIEEIEDQLTVYRDTSEVIELNRRAAREPVGVASGLWSMLRFADQLHRDSSGAYDLTAGPLSKLWGFHTREGRLPSQEEIEATLEQVGWGNVLLDHQQNEIAFKRDGITINFNSIGKGYALDRAAAVLESQGVSDFMFHGGRSSLLARGARTGGRGWPSGLRHPLRPQQQIASFWIVNEALSTSGSATQSFLHRGKRYGHLIDPRTGWPADTMHTVTVIAPTAMEADALSTAFYIMGPEATEDYCQRHPEIKTLMVLPTGRPGEVEVRGLNLSEEEWQPRAD